MNNKPLTSVPIDQIIKEYEPGPRRHWFDSETLNFFNSRLPHCGFRASNGSVLFVSSEKPPSGRRAYTVRRLECPGCIETVGDFGAYKTNAQATAAAKRLAREGNL